MKRSEINQAIGKALEAFRKENITLPRFAYFTKDEWKMHRNECDTVFRVMLGWDVTDFGSGDFTHTGCVLFTSRNGSFDDKSVGVPYAEKYLVFFDNPTQEIPFHFHFMKHEDIINRAGGVMCVELYNSKENGDIDRDTDVTYYSDSIRYTVSAGTVVEITTGNSITLTPGLYHRITVKAGTGTLIAGEVSSINDDRVDNRFYAPTDRFCGIEEDEPAKYVLGNEYPSL